jgi:hypothetical protein
MMLKFIDWFLWGLFMGMGWAVSNAVLAFIVSILSHHS